MGLVVIGMIILRLHNKDEFEKSVTQRLASQRRLSNSLALPTHAGFLSNFEAKRLHDP
jgi:hypothetical protein